MTMSGGGVKVVVREWLSGCDVPDIITSDLGFQFVWQEACSLMTIGHSIVFTFRFITDE